MKKRLLLITLMVALFVCVLALAVSAEGVPAEGRLGTNTIVEGIALPTVIDAESQIQMDDGLIYPSFYFFKDQTTTAYDFTRVTKADGTNYTIDNIVKMEIPHGITKMDNLGYRDNNKTTLTHVRIPNTITAHNWNGGFRTTKSLVSVEFEEGYSYKIFGSMFHSCPVANFVIPEGVTEIESESMCSMGITNLVIPDNVVTIGSNAFSGNSLTSVTISENSKLKSIGYRVFASQPNLTSTIYLPSSLETLGESAFASSYNIAGFENLENTKITAIPAQAFYECKVITSLKFPTTVTSIGKQAFNKAISLVSITGLENVTTISNVSAFSGCTALESVDLSNKITSLPDSTFDGCKALKFVNTENVTSFGIKCFQNCSSIDGIVINSAVTSIPGDFCKGCTSLTSIVIPAGVTSIGGYAFDGCTKLTSVTNYAEGITTLNGNTFASCPITEFNMPDSLTSIGQSCFVGAQFTEIDIPNTVSSIGSGAFQSCTKLTFLRFPESLTQIPHDSLKGSSSVVVVVPKGCTSIYSQYSLQNTGISKIIFTGTADSAFVASVQEKASSYVSKIEYANHCEYYYNNVHNAPYSYVFTSYIEECYTEGVCSRCGITNKGETYDAIVSFLGIAIKMDGTATTAGYALNDDSLAVYVSEGYTFNYGVVGYIPTAEQGNSYSPLTIGENGVEAIDKQYTIHADISGEYASVDFIIKGFPQEAVSLIMCMYVYNGTDIVYLCGATEADLEQVATAYAV
ncbi:MAG: leucine-rich repeat domain-containing protein, partial [Clostridia bacterium]|nr:leucine-rich repeat domain-containing protein [Clostridia bacterium]